VNFDWDGRKALITGASGGIGAALAEGLASKGVTVGICARREDRLAEVLERCRAHAPDSQMWVVDLADLDAVEAFAVDADDGLGGIDMLVNNAGIPKRRKVADLSVAEVDAVMALNYLSPVRLVMALLPRLLERARAGGRRGKIVNLSSVAARLSPPGEAAYSASKAAVVAFSETLVAELWDEPVDVHLVHPGVIDTELFDLPDNDPLLATDMERLPPSAVFEALEAQMESGALEAYVPDWFADIASGKAGNVEGFIAGAVEYAKQQEGRS